MSGTRLVTLTMACGHKQTSEFHLHDDYPLIPRCAEFKKDVCFMCGMVKFRAIMEQAGKTEAEIAGMYQKIAIAVV